MYSEDDSMRTCSKSLIQTNTCVLESVSEKSKSGWSDRNQYYDLQEKELTKHKKH